MSPFVHQLAEHARGIGAVAALAVVCLVQYAHHLVRMRAARRLTDRFREEVDGLEDELDVCREESQLAALENEFLREFVSQPDLGRAIDVLLRKLVPRPKEDFAALFLYDEGALELHRCRGIDDPHELVVDADLESRTLRDGAVVLEGESLGSSRFLAGLQPRIRGRARQLVFLRIGHADDAVGLLVTTSLYPSAISRRRQLMLARRITTSIAGNVRWARTLESREDELRSTTEMLELRAITDRAYPTPLAMVERFVDGVRRIVGAQRVALFLATRDAGEQLRPIVRAGVTLHPGFDVRYREHETRLAEYGLACDEPAPHEIDRTTRLRIGVNSLVEVAVVAPVTRDEALMGVLVLTSRTTSIDPSRSRILEWSCQQLARTLDRVLVQANAERRARQDALTSLANRGEFDGRITAEIGRAIESESPLSLLLIDLDHFKQVNDTHGHRAGDEVLRSTARVLRRSVSKIRSDDRALVARYGGEEIAVLLPGMGPAGAQRVAEDLRESVERQVIAHDDRVLTVTASIGVATFPESARDAETLVSAADAALYRAKELGRNRVVLATPGRREHRVPAAAGVPTLER